MEVTDHISVKGMMHLLISGHFESKDRLYQTLEDVYNNFTSIHKALAALFNDMNSKCPEETYSIGATGLIITFCRCSLKRIIEEDGITIHENRARLLADIELFLVSQVKCCTDYLSSNYYSLPFAETEQSVSDMIEKIGESYSEPSSIYCYQLVINYDLMMEFLDQSAEDFEYLEDLDIRTPPKEYFIVLRNYLELLAKERIHRDNLQKMLIAVENAAYEMLRYVLIADIQSGFRAGVLQALMLQPDCFSSNAPLMSDELVIGYVKCVQDNLLELRKNNIIDLTGTLKDQLKILYEGLSFLMHLLIIYLPKHNFEQVKLSDIRLDFQDLTRDVGSVICSCFENSMKEEMSLGLFDLIEKTDVIKGEIIKTICCNVLQKKERESSKQGQLASLTLFLQNLKEFMDREPSLIVSWKDHENLVLFIFYLKQNNDGDDNCIGDDEFSRNTIQLDVALINHEDLNEVLISAQVVAFKMACCAMLRRYGKLHWWELYLVTEECIDLHMRVGILKAIVLSSTTDWTSELLIAYVECVQDCQVELLRDEAIDALKDQFNILRDGLSFLVRLLKSYRHEEEKLSHINVGFQDLVRGVGSVICLCFNCRVNGDTEMKHSITELSNLIEKMNLIIVDTEELLHLVVLSKIGCESPKTNQLGSLSLLLENWNGIMECESDLIITWKDQFQMIHENLVLFKSFVTSSSTGDDESQRLSRSIMDAGHVAEYLLTTFSVGTCPVRCRDLWILEFMKHVELIKANVMKANEKKGNLKEISTATNDRNQLSAKELLVPTSTDVMVGFEVEMKLIRERLAGHLKQLNVISIVGMPGLGKTTLARKVYEDPFTIKYFDARAWCYVSQEYNKKELLLAILDFLTKLTDGIRGQSETDLSVMVHKQLMGRRYFIVLDDIWDIDVFMYLKRFFPDDNKGSRIMLTSRSKVIGSKAQCNEDLIEPGFLTDEQSWDLLKRKVYNKGKCPPELCLIGMEIAKNCKGLPLALVVVGGVLAKGTHKRFFWEQVAENLSSYLARDSPQFMAALELSYEFLPDWLKPMFLYVGVFTEDMEIPVDKLMRLWMAEGFVQSTESGSLEIHAERNLMDLIDRSLVMVTKRSWDGRLKACHVHDLLRDMCLTKAKEENFMHQVHVHSVSPDPVMYQRRLSIIFQSNDKIMLSHLAQYEDLSKFSIAPPICSLIYINVGPGKQVFEDTIEEQGDLAPIISSLKLLKVLDANAYIFGITQDVLDKDLIMLVHLRYLSIYGEFKSIPSAISRLRSLETLFIKGDPFRSCIDVSETIWEMKKLRHLHIENAWLSAVPENPFILDNLQTLSNPHIDLGKEDTLFRRVPCLKKLRCLFNYYRPGQFPNFKSLGKLESLTMGIRFLERSVRSVIGPMKLPLTLKKLNISGFGLEWSETTMLKTLPNLEVLKLKQNSAEDECWDMGDDDVFTNLKYLMLCGLRIRRWSASSVNFPSLEKLALQFCYLLDEIPSDLGEIDTLRKIEVSWCCNSTANLVKEIQKEQEEFGNESLEFYFYQNRDV